MKNNEIKLIAEQRGKEELLVMSLVSEQIQDSNEDAKTFVLRMMKNDSHVEEYLRNFISDSERLISEEDWNFLAAWVKLTLGYPPSTINAKRLKGNF